MKQKGFSLIGILIVIAVFVLTAGGVAVWRFVGSKPTVTVGESVVPGLSEDVRGLPTSAPTFITPFSENLNKVQMILSKNVYQKGETITITVKNVSDHQLGYYDCPGPKGGVVWFERKIGQTWEEEVSLAGADYGSKRPCYPRFLEAGQELPNARYISTEIPLGTYRAAFQYIDGTVYSNEFQIL